MMPLSKIHFKSLSAVSKAFYSAKLGPQQKIIMLCGAPGVGKGMYSRLLAEDFGYVQISTGDEIRKILGGEKTSLSQRAIDKLGKYVNAGRLAPDETIMEILYHKINEPDSAKGVILDGFPRTVNQLNMFRRNFPIHLAVNIEQNYDYLMASILGRRTCMCCGMSYSAFSFYKDGYELDVQMPAKKGECDNCHGPVRTREDDKEEIVKQRLKEYKTKTSPLLQSLDEVGIMKQFNAKRGIRDYPRLQQMIVSEVGRPCYYNDQLAASSRGMPIYYD